MKNSPHRFKHLRNKALRQNNLTDVKEQTHQNQIDRHKDRITTIVLEQIRPLKDHLKPIDTEKAKTLLDYYVKHWERDKHAHDHSFHASKRSTPGEVDREEEPFSKSHTTQQKMRQHNEMKILNKSNKVARQMLKREHQQQHKKAA